MDASIKKKIKKDSKQKILNAAVKLFARKGFDAVSIREICKEAEINLCMISYYFGGKQELYNAIIEDLVQQQIEYANTFMDLDKNPKTLLKQEQIDFLLKIFDKIIDFLYSQISSDLMILLLKEQQKPNSMIDSPVYNYIRELIACIFDKDKNDKEMIFKTVFIFSQINSPKIMPAFTLRLLGQDNFSQDDIKIIKENIKFYIKLILKEAKIV